MIGIAASREEVERTLEFVPFLDFTLASMSGFFMSFTHKSWAECSVRTMKS
ncbi:MAG: hypothetical protein U0744_01495 [Gemmataceae bacterium]